MGTFGQSPGRPKAEDLHVPLCQGTSKSRGAACKNPAIAGLKFCQHHIGPKDIKAERSLIEKFAQFASDGLDVGLYLLHHGPPEVQAKMVKLGLDRALPVNNPALTIHLNTTTAADPGAGQVHVVMARMAQLAAAKETVVETAPMSQETAFEPDPETDVWSKAPPEDDDDQIIDGVIEEDPVPLRVVRQEPEPAPKPGAFFLPKKTSREGSFERMRDLDPMGLRHGVTRL